MLLMELVFCTTAALYVMIWDRIYEDNMNSYLGFYPEGTIPPPWTPMRQFKVWLKNFGTWILLFTNLVPICLLVTLECIKFFQARLIEVDA
jgi:phospholipid-transporting ATPase